MNILKEAVSQKDLSKRNIFAALIVLLICIVYLFPAFLGKVDTPFDIRDTRMYPWSYYAVEKKSKMDTIWQEEISKEHGVVDSETNSLVFNLQVPPLSTNKTIYDVHLGDLLKQHSVINPKERVYFFYFDFKPISKGQEKLSIEVKLVEKETGSFFSSPISALSYSKNEKGETTLWQKWSYRLPLEKLTENNLSIEDLNDYKFEIIAKNTSTINPASVYLKEVKLLRVDFSGSLKAHNEYNSDLIQGFTPNREYYSESLKRGKICFWNNYILTGFELFSEPQVGYFHPLYLLTYFLFEHFNAHLLITYLFLFSAGFGAYLLGRHWGLDFSPSILAAFVYMFNPFTTVWFSYEHVLMASGTLPFLLLAYEKHLKEEKILTKYLLLSGLLSGLIFLSGHLQVVYYTLIFFFLFAVFRLVQDFAFISKNYKKHIFSILFIFFIGLIISSVMIVPFLTFLPDSHRVPISLSGIKKRSVELNAFLTLIEPFQSEKKIKFFNNNYMYFGFLPFLLSLFSLKKILLKDKLTMFFWIASLLSLLICTGSPLFFLVKDFLPGFKQLQHNRLLMIFSLCVPFLAGIGFQVFLDYTSFIKQRIKLFLISIILLCSVVDLVYHSSYFVTWSDRKEYKPIHKQGALEFLKKEQKRTAEPFRILSVTKRKLGERLLELSIAVPNTLLPYKIEDATGYSSLIPKDLYALFVYIQTQNPDVLYSKELLDLFENINIPYPITNFKSKIVDLLNVKYFLTPEVIKLEDKKVNKIYSGDCNIYENKNYLPRAFVVPEFRVIESPKDTIVELDSERFNPREEVILMLAPLEHVIARNAVTKQSQKRETNDVEAISALEYNVDFVKYDLDNITLRVKTNQPGFLVLGHNLDKNWKVKVNGKKDKHIQANLVQRAVYLPSAGTYLIEFYYFSEIFLISFMITCLGFLILLVLAVYLKYSHKNEDVTRLL